MIPSITPQTRSLDAEHITAKEILIVDHMPAYDAHLVSNVPEDQANKFRFFKNTVAELFWKAGANFDDKIFYVDSYFLFDDFLNIRIYKDHFFINEAKSFKRRLSAWDVVPEYDVTHSLTFMSNKSRPHRDLCSLMLEAWKQENLNFKYSYNSSPFSLMTAIDLLEGSNVPNNKLLEDKFIGDVDKLKKWSHGGYQYNAQNVDIFKFLFASIFENCAVGIITEPVFYERGNMFSEKTIMSIYSGQFLIWPGAYKMAETAKLLGFDIFEDIIDHSYQYAENPGQRVVEAFLKNKELLFDTTKLDKLRKANINRLNKNLTLVRDMETLSNNLNNLHHK